MPRLPINQPYTITTPFGVPDPNAKHGYHAGIDLAVPVGREVYAAAFGTVYSVADGGNQGIAVQIFDGQYYPHTFHMNQRVVSPGQKVAQGQLVGYSGNTGLSTGPHVHFGVGKKPYISTTSINDYIDPTEYTKKKEEPMLNDEITKYLYGAFTGREPNQGELDSWRGRETNTLVTTLVTSKEANQRYAEVQAALKGTAQTKLDQIKKIVN